MSTPRKTSASHRLSGAFASHPKRELERAQELMDPRVLGDPPRALSAAQKACWREIAGTCLPGVLSRSDRIALHLASCLFASFKADSADFSAAKLGRLESLLASFAMTPTARTRIQSRDVLAGTFGDGNDPSNPFYNNGRFTARE